MPAPDIGRRIEDDVMATHLAYHLEQIDYHRRLVTGQFGEVETLPVPI